MGQEECLGARSLVPTTAQCFGGRVVEPQGEDQHPWDRHMEKHEQDCLFFFFHIISFNGVDLTQRVREMSGQVFFLPPACIYASTWSLSLLRIISKQRELSNQ